MKCGSCCCCCCYSCLYTIKNSCSAYVIITLLGNELKFIIPLCTSQLTVVGKTLLNAFRRDNCSLQVYTVDNLYDRRLCTVHYYQQNL